MQQKKSAPDLPDEKRLKHQTCPVCGKTFPLNWDESDFPRTLVIRGCPSGGIYDVSIVCPHCQYEEAL